MKIEYIKLINFAGIYNGTGLYEFEIDFTRSDNRIILLNGKNGSGKSTLINTLQPFSGMFDSCGNEFDIILPNVDGYKEIHIRSDKKLFKICHHYERNTRTKSFTVKSTISRFKNNEWKDLNPSGKQLLFNDIVKKKLHCDPNILQISKLGSNVNSFITRKSTERKEYIGQFLPNIDEYLEYYKIVNKKITLAKADTKVIANQLERLGKYEEVEKELEVYTTQFNNFSKQKENVAKSGNKILGKLEMMNYDDITNRVSEIAEQLRNLDINKELEKKIVIEDKEEYQFKFEKFRKLYERYKIYKNQHLEALESKEKEKDKVNNKLEECKDEENIEKLKKEIEELKETLANLDESEIKLNKIIESLRLGTFKTYEDAVEFRYKILDLKRIIQENKDMIPLKYLDNIEIYRKKSNMEALLAKIKEYEKIRDIELEDIRKLINKHEKHLPLVAILDKRPKKCNIDDCPFISEGLKYIDVPKKLAVLKVREIELSNIVANELEYYEDDKLVYDSLIRLKRYYYDNEKDFSRIVESFSEFLKLLNTNRIEKIMESVDAHVSQKAAEKTRKYTVSTIEGFTNHIKAIKSDKNSRQYMLIIIKDITKEINNLHSLIDEDIHNIKKYKKLMEKYQNMIDTVDKVIEKKKLSDEWKSLKETYQLIKGYEDELNELKEQEEIISESLENSREKKEDLQIRLGQIKEFDERRKKLDKEFKILEILRDTLSPVKGIPLVYIGQFLEKTKLIANRLLSGVYDSTYQISNFNLTDKEFAIQISKKNKSIIPDIRRCSVGEQSMTGISISFALIEQSMTEYNIICLDEMDSQLDEYNRQTFIDILNQQLETLGIDQCFIISHNPYFNDFSLDIIEFPGSNIENDNKNIIAKFE